MKGPGSMLIQGFFYFIENCLFYAAVFHLTPFENSLSKVFLSTANSNSGCRILKEKNMHLIIISEHLNKLEIYSIGVKISFNCADIIKYYHI